MKYQAPDEDLDSESPRSYELRYKKTDPLVKIYLREAGSIPILSEEEIFISFQGLETYILRIKRVISYFHTGVGEIFSLYEKMEKDTTILDDLNYFVEDGMRVKTLDSDDWRDEFARDAEALIPLVKKKKSLEKSMLKNGVKSSRTRKKRKVQREITNLVVSIRLHPLQIMNVSRKLITKVRETLEKKDSPAGKNPLGKKEKNLGVSLTTAKRLVDCLEKLEKDIKKSKQYIVKSNLRLVVNIAKNYVEGGVPLMDLIQEGNIGLMRATNRYDYHKGYHFSTYATWWIRQAVTRAIADQGKTIRIPVHMVEMLKKYHRSHNKLIQQLGRKPTIMELSTDMDMTEKRIREVKSYAKKVVSLDMPILNGEKRISDTLQDNVTKSPMEITEKIKLQENMEQLLKILNHREEEILKMRFGIGGYTEHTLSEIGKKIGVCRERVRQLEKRSLKKLGNLLVKPAFSANKFY